MRHVKVVIIGEPGAGKTALASRIVHGTFSPDAEATIGAAYLTCDREGARFELWDTAGQERYRALVPMYLRGADVAWVVAASTEAPDAAAAAFAYWEKKAARVAPACTVMRVWAKTDLGAPPAAGGVRTSAKTGAGCDCLLEQTAKARGREPAAKVGTLEVSSVAGGAASARDSPWCCV